MGRALIAAAGGPGTRVVVVPTAATNENPYVAGENGIRHFQRLGAIAEKLLIVDDESAAQLERFNCVYFTGGDPVYLLDTLRGSQAWEAVRRVHARGGLKVR